MGMSVLIAYMSCIMGIPKLEHRQVWPTMFGSEPGPLQEPSMHSQNFDTSICKRIRLPICAYDTILVAFFGSSCLQL